LAGITVYTLDLPGHGRSGVQGCKTIESYADTVASFVRAVGAKQSIIVGHSMGGAIALTMALKHSEWMSGLVLIASGARLRVSPSILEKIRDDFEDSVGLITRLAWAQDTPSTLSQRGRDALLETGPDVLRDDFSACDRFDVMGRLEEITPPTLVIAGTADQLTPPKYGRFLTEHLPNAQLVLVEGAGHMVMLERSAETAKAIQEFVRKQV
jgi:pimeloyl-ACP methyl ester carboxylesterase